MTLTSGRITFVESSRPPIPTSITAMSTLSRAKWSNAIAVVISKNDGRIRSIAFAVAADECHHRFFGDHLSVDANALAEIFQVRRRE